MAGHIVLSVSHNHESAINSWERFINREVDGFVFQAPFGKVLVTHGHEDGALSVDPEFAAQYAVVVCCHPQQVRAHTGVNTLGHWQGKTCIVPREISGKYAAEFVVWERGC